MVFGDINEVSIGMCEISIITTTNTVATDGDLQEFKTSKLIVGTKVEGIIAIDQVTTRVILESKLGQEANIGIVLDVSKLHCCCACC